MIQPRPLSRILKSRLRQPWLASQLIRLERRSYNLELFLELRRQQVAYILNPESNELHALRFGIIGGSHNLLDSNLGEFYPLWEMGLRRISTMKNGSIIPVVERFTGELLAEFELNKCAHCFPAAKTPFERLADFYPN